ncbi:MAG: NFACT RNA binding domain-containing protein [Cytophagaceae bacterium]|nr:NFACT RNA binding domain-containing protein [Cytophagaceae bacterium]MDW8455955.1 NFACT RNA binding domain-containing protein [Cytophagaceae bacterium]
MTINYYVLRILSKELNALVKGQEIDSCYKVSPDELVILIKGFTEVIKVNLFHDFTCVYIPQRYALPAKNRHGVFKKIKGLKILETVQHENDRGFHFELENDFSLVFKMHGSRSNIILLEKNLVTEVFKKNLKLDYQFDLSNVHKISNISFSSFVEQSCNAKKIFPAIDEEIQQWLDAKGYAGMEPQQKWDLLTNAQETLLNPLFNVYRMGDDVKLTILHQNNSLLLTHSALEACNAYARLKEPVFFLEKEKQAVLLELFREKKLLQKQIADLQKRQLILTQSTPPGEIADVIMANLHQLKQGDEEVTLINFYNDMPIKIKLRKELSPQKNAEWYYKKSKALEKEKRNIIETLEQKKVQLSKLDENIDTINQIQQLKALRQYIKKEISPPSNDDLIKEQLFKKFIIDDFVILVGKNAKNNDLLTQRYSYKEDLWLHARDAPGSHVLVKYKPGKRYPNNVIEKAAAIAAYFSKRRGESLCPVIVTYKKYVRKKKGAAPGEVVVEKEKTFLVEPGLPLNT